jgi:hypothetical protein
MGMSKLSQSFWIADLMVLAMLAFFIVLAGVDVGESTALAVAVGALALIGAGETYRRHRIADHTALSPEGRRWRERRGF